MASKDKKFSKKVKYSYPIEVLMTLPKDVREFIMRDDEAQQKATERSLKCRCNGFKRCEKSEEECQHCPIFLKGRQNGGYASIEFLTEELGVDIQNHDNATEIQHYLFILRDMVKDVAPQMQYLAEALYNLETEEEIAEALGIPRDTLHSQKAKFQSAMRKKYNRQ